MVKVKDKIVLQFGIFPITKIISFLKKKIIRRNISMTAYGFFI